MEADAVGVVGQVARAALAIAEEKLIGVIAHPAELAQRDSTAGLVVFLFLVLLVAERHRDATLSLPGLEVVGCELEETALALRAGVLSVCPIPDALVVEDMGASV